MKVIHTVAAMQRQVKAWRASQSPVGFVPTMGYLHEGHLSLVAFARKAVGAAGKVVLSIYVNPTQFAPTEDLSAYPRDFARDSKLCEQAGVDVIFAPADGQMYPDGYSTYVVEEQLSQRMEGAARPTHFRGVTTIVAKLFNIIQPEVAVFGAKDFQQAAVIKKMVADLNFPLKIIVGPTLRESNGLAMSSRNKYLSPAQREQATVLSRALRRAKAAVANGPVSAKRLERELATLIASAPESRLDYIEFFDPETLVPVEKVQKGTQVALAVYVGKTRLIDNGRL